MDRPNDDFACVAKNLLPYTSQQLPISVDGRTWMMRYLDEGPSSGDDATNASAAPVPKATLLCVHGNPTWSFTFRSIVARFSESYRVIAVDHLGCGRSDKPTQREFAYTMAAHRDNLRMLVETLDLNRVVLIAHDWGGAIGLSAMTQCLHRVAGLVLLNTAAFPPPYMPWRIAACRWPLVGRPAVRGLNCFAVAALRMAMARTKLSREAARGLLAPYNSWRNRVAIDAFVRDIPLTNDHPTMATLRELEAALPRWSKLPIELIWGMKDWCFRPECLQRFEAVWPHAIVHRLPTTGHYVMEDSPDETLDRIGDYLTNHVA
ncbi:MAG: alpha/beta fold hydrolase [Planctomycetota bacterium]